jgi:hypothetical protein
MFGIVSNKGDVFIVNEDGELTHSLRWHGDSVAISRTRIAVADTNPLRVYDIGTRELHLDHLPDFLSCPWMKKDTKMVFTHDSEYIVVSRQSYNDESIMAMKISAEPIPEHRVQNNTIVFNEWYSCTGENLLCASPVDNRIAYTAGELIKVCHPSTPDRYMWLKYPRPLAMSFSGNGQELVCAFAWGILLFDVNTGSVNRRVETQRPLKTIVSSTESVFLVGEDEDGVLVWDENLSSKMIPGIKSVSGFIRNEIVFRETSTSIGFYNLDTGEVQSMDVEFPIQDQDGLSIYSMTVLAPETSVLL